MSSRLKHRTAKGAGVLRSFAIVVFLMSGAHALAQHHGDAPTKYPDPSLHGPPIRWTTEMSADEESSFTESPATGQAEFILERETLKFSWKVSFSGLLGKVTGVRVHGPQTPGGEAGVLIDLGQASSGLNSPVEGFGTLDDGQLRYLVTDRMYLQITTTKYPKGEIRGQLQRVRPAAASN